MNHTIAELGEGRGMFAPEAAVCTRLSQDFSAWVGFVCRGHHLECSF